MGSERKRILCVEDDLDSCDMLRVLLHQYEVVTANTVGEGLKKARAERFDLYLLDSRYPDGSGVELCRQLRLFDTQTPVVFHSGLEGESDIRDAMNAGAQAYLVKPIGIDELEGSIERLLAPPQNPSRIDS
jgi:two-component system, OmpR family, alkaline phosphatase synthesis response regulator PhoP